MADIPDLARAPTTAHRYLILTNTTDGDIIAVNTNHIVALVVEAASPNDVTLVFDITVPGQGNQSEIFTASATGADAQELKDWFAHQQRGNVTATW